LPDPSRGAPPTRWSLVASLSLAAGLAAFVGAASVARGAHLWHYDAKAHLVVARRVLDSLTPGWRQLGAIWLPLPHLLNVLPVQNDWLYHTGLFATALGLVAFILGLAALGWAVARATRDPWAGVVALAVPALNPGWLYLASTPLTEPLFLGLLGGLVYGMVRYLEEPRTRTLVVAVVCSALVVLVRYEAWPAAALAMGLAAWRSRTPRRWALTLGLGFLLPVGGYGLHAWWVSGVPFQAMSAEYLTRSRGDLTGSLALLVAGLTSSFGWPLLLAGGVALAFCAAAAWRPSATLARLALVCATPLLVTLTAYLSGHPEKARYPLLLAPALALGLGTMTAGRRWLQACALALVALQALPAGAPIPVLEEATRDRIAVMARRDVVDALRAEYHGGHLLVSLAALAPVVYETRIPIREFVYEENTGFWERAVAEPSLEVAWVLIADGDVLDGVRERRPAFPEGFVPVAHSGRLTVYRRLDEAMPHRLAAR